MRHMYEHGPTTITPAYNQEHSITKNVISMRLSRTSIALNPTCVFNALILSLTNQDLHAAQQLLDCYPGELSPDKVAANRRLEASIAERVDRWRDARYRVLMQELMKPARSSRSPAP